MDDQRRGSRTARPAIPARRKDSMNRFSDKLRVIPRIAWVIALLVSACFSTLLMYVVIPHGRNVKYWPQAGQLAYAILPGLVLFAWVLLIGYINADARRRGMRYVMWTLLAI